MKTWFTLPPPLLIPAEIATGIQVADATVIDRALFLFEAREACFLTVFRHRAEEKQRQNFFFLVCLRRQKKKAKKLRGEEEEKGLPGFVIKSRQREKFTVDFVFKKEEKARAVTVFCSRKRKSKVYVIIRMRCKAKEQNMVFIPSWHVQKGNFTV